MQISDLDEETQDLDWFALDAEGAIGHFATGGRGAVPQSVACSMEDLKKVTRYFRRLPFGSSPGVASMKIESYVWLEEEAARERYLKDFMEMASRGFFSFDYIHTQKRPTGYFRVAMPLVALRAADLPDDVRRILERTILGAISFRAVDEIGLEALEQVPGSGK